MKRVLALIALLAGCAHTPAELHAYCQRWAAEFLAAGSHVNPAAYREDLVSTCMALKGVPYATQQLPISSASDWSNPAVPEAEFNRTFGHDKANCIERGYVGQASGGSNQAGVVGYGSIVRGSQSGVYASAPIFNNELYVACMNAAGWELINPETR